MWPSYNYGRSMPSQDPPPTTLRADAPTFEPPSAGAHSAVGPKRTSLAQAQSPDLGGEDASEGVTTMMMRNLPNKYTQIMLREEIDNAGFAGAYDFMHLPIDPETNANRGYAFINFTSPAKARAFANAFEGRRLNRLNSSKVVFVTHAALQGFEANYAHYSTARVLRGDPAARPLFLREPRASDSALARKGLRRKARRRGRHSLIDMAAQLQAPSTAAGIADVAATTAPAPGSGLRAPAPGSRATKASFCPFCGGRRQPEFQFCEFCGACLPAA